MNKCFITEFKDKEIIRKRANGYKKIVIDSKVNSPCMVSVTSKDVDSDCPILNIKTVSDKNKKPVYLVLCKEIGIFGHLADFSNKISVIMLDSGFMLITLYKGALVIKDNDLLKVITVEVDEIPHLDKENIKWVSANDFLGNIRYYKDKGEFPFDFEFFFNITGGMVKNLSTIKFVHLADEDIDMSLGAYAIAKCVSDKKEIVSENTEKKEEKVKNKEEVEKKNKALDDYFNKKSKRQRNL